MNEMKTATEKESEYKQILETFVNRDMDDVKKCSKNCAGDGHETQFLSLGILNVGDICVVHLLACIVSLSLATGQYYLARRYVANNVSGKDGDEPPSGVRIMIWAPRVVDYQRSSRSN